MTSGQGDPRSESGAAGSVSKDKDSASRQDQPAAQAKPDKIKEIGGPKGPEPTRYGDWEKGGRCSDF